MIKINLLPYRAQQKNQLVLQQIIIGIIPVVITIFVIGIFWWSAKADIATAETKIATLNQEIAKQKKTMKEIASFKKKKALISKKMGVIGKLQKGKTGPVHVLDELAANLPGRLWLTQVKQSGMKLDLAGTSLDNLSISNYMVNLEKSDFFSAVDLLSIKTKKGAKGEGAHLKEFKITCNITYKKETKSKS